jgi:hypothetical protein
MSDYLNKSSFVTSPSLSMRTMSNRNAFDGGYQPKSTMWSGVTSSVYPQGKMKKNKPFGPFEIAKSMYSILGPQYNPKQNTIEPFRKGGFNFPLKGGYSVSGRYKKRNRDGGYDWRVGISTPIKW